MDEIPKTRYDKLVDAFMKVIRDFRESDPDFRDCKTINVRQESQMRRTISIVSPDFRGINIEITPMASESR